MQVQVRFAESTELLSRKFQEKFSDACKELKTLAPQLRFIQIDRVNPSSYMRYEVHICRRRLMDGDGVEVWMRKHHGS